MNHTTAPSTNKSTDCVNVEKLWVAIELRGKVLLIPPADAKVLLRLLTGLFAADEPTYDDGTEVWK